MITARFTTLCGCTRIAQLPEALDYYIMPLGLPIKVVTMTDQIKFDSMKTRTFTCRGWSSGSIYEYLEVDK